MSPPTTSTSIGTAPSRHQQAQPEPRRARTRAEIEREAAWQALHAPFPASGPAAGGLRGGSAAALESTLPDTDSGSSIKAPGVTEVRRRRGSPTVWDAHAPAAPSDWRSVQGGRLPAQHLQRSLAAADESNSSAQATVDRFHRREGGARDPPPPPSDPHGRRGQPKSSIPPAALGDSGDSGILFPLADSSVSSLPVPRSPFPLQGGKTYDFVEN